MAKKIRKILIVEDDPQSRSMVAMAAESWGYVTIQTSDGQRGWEVLNDNPDVAMLILDIGLPGLDGRDFIARLRQEENFKNLPLIVVSGIVTLNEIEELLSLGASRFLAKPFSIAELKEYTDKLLEHN